MSANITQFYSDIDSIGKNGVKTMHEVGSFITGAAKLLAPAGTSGYLRAGIGYRISGEGNRITAHVGTENEYAMYVEFGTGPKGAANHAGVSPDFQVSYTRAPWWVHESMLDPSAIERYHWFSIETKDGRFYRITGQAAQPFLYPALKDNEQTVLSIIENGLMGAIVR